MSFFETVLDVVLGSPLERELERDVAELTAENVMLRRELQNIRVAHEPLYAAIYPQKIQGKK